MHPFVAEAWLSSIPVIFVSLFLGPGVSCTLSHQDQDVGGWRYSYDAPSIWLKPDFPGARDSKAYFHLVMAWIMFILPSKELAPWADEVHSCRKLLSSSSDVKPSADSTRSHGPGWKLKLVIIVTMCIVAVVASKIFLCFLLCWQKSREKRICDVRITSGKMVLFLASDNPLFSKMLLRKTEKLTAKDIIGSGAYGTVYKLVMDDGTTFAAKKLSRVDIESNQGFERELQTLGDIKHRNLVTLYGYYSAPHIHLLYYNLMANGSLRDQLHERPPTASCLDWPARIKIALGAARGIAYLHHDCVPHIIHRDIKSSNILLDEHMEAHISDFGLAKLINPHETHVTTILAGTLGYLAPEYVETGKAALSGDIYSFGIVLFELVTGRRPTEVAFAEKGLNLVTWVKDLSVNGCLEDAFAEDLKDHWEKIELAQTVDVATLCVRSNPRDRPTMNQVVHMLEKIKAKAFSSFP